MAGENKVTVKIWVDGGVIKVEPEVVRLSASNGDYVIWELNSEEPDFLVWFGENSPFRETYFTKQKNNSGAPKITPPPGHDVRFYKYIVGVGPLTLDPGVIILK
jgi:hypothetical protein